MVNSLMVVARAKISDAGEWGWASSTSGDMYSRVPTLRGNRGGQQAVVCVWLRLGVEGGGAAHGTWGQG
jgi:hypothetical protein